MTVLPSQEVRAAVSGLGCGRSRGALMPGHFRRNARDIIRCCSHYSTLAVITARRTEGKAWGCLGTWDLEDPSLGSPVRSRSSG